MKMIFLGPPGAGKGTAAVKAAAERGLAHISTGDLFRAAIKNQTALGVQVQAILKSGNLVPDELTVSLVKERLEAADCKKGFILDGFPRTIPQAEALRDFARIDAVVNFNLSDAEVVRRLSGRRTCKGCGATFHVEFMPPKTSGICDKCGSELIIRPDDEETAIRNRLSVYHAQTAPLIAFYQAEGSLKDLDASPAPDLVLHELGKLIG